MKIEKIIKEIADYKARVSLLKSHISEYHNDIENIMACAQKGKVDVIEQSHRLYGAMPKFKDDAKKYKVSPLSIDYANYKSYIHDAEIEIAELEAKTEYLESQIEAHRNLQKEQALIKLREKEIDLEIARLQTQSIDQAGNEINAIMSSLKRDGGSDG